MGIDPDELKAIEEVRVAAIEHFSERGRSLPPGAFFLASLSLACDFSALAESLYENFVDAETRANPEYSFAAVYERERARMRKLVFEPHE